MKIVCILLLAASLAVSARTASQTITLSCTGSPIKQVFSEIKKQTGFLFFCNKQLLAETKPVSLTVTDMPLLDFLHIVLKDQPLNFRVDGKTITLSRKATPEPSRQMYSSSLVDTLSQEITISGRVTDENNSPLQGVTVSLNSNVSTITDVDGRFSLRVTKGAALIFSFVGYQERKWNITGDGFIQVQLFPRELNMDEVVVIGYGTQSRKNLATATSSVTAADIKSAVITTVDQALQGRTTGVQVVETSGEPGAATVVRIRGNNSLSGSNEPLYVLDGFPMPPHVEASSTFYGTYQQNGLYGINPNDIESIEVLKDAAATAIYGSRGANGVVLITTKAGKSGEGKVEVMSRTSTGKMGHDLPMMNSKQYAEIVNESYLLRGNPIPFDDISAINTNTDWMEAITKRSFRQDLSLNISGGGPKTSYFLSGNYLIDDGILLASGNKRGSIRANINSDVNNWYTVKAQLSFVRQQSDRAITSSRGWPSSGGSFFDALRAAPTLDQNYSGNNTAGIPGFAAGYWFPNPYNELISKTDIQKNDFSVMNLENIFTLTKSWKLFVNFGSNQNLTRRQLFMPATTAEGHTGDGLGNNNMANTYSYNVNAFLQYEDVFGFSKVSATGGIEYNKQQVELLKTTSSGFGVPLFGINNIGSAQVQSVGSYKEDRVIQSAFGRVNYTFKDKYVLNSSLRLDGASPFAQNKKYAIFPAIAAAWNVSQEGFMMSAPFVSDAKIRTSYGETGSQAISPYSSLAQYGSAFYQTGTGSTINTVLFPNSLGNDNLSWERTKQFNLGVDFSLFANLLNVSFDYYNKRTNNLLQPRTLPSQSGYSSITDNYGSIRNKGLELTLQANLVNNNTLRFSTRFNISRNKTTLINLGDKTTPDYVRLDGNLLAGVSGILAPGKEVGLFYGYNLTGLIQDKDITAGVPNYPFPGNENEQVAGGWKYEDLNKDGFVNEADRQVLGKSNPDFVFGWNNELSWKRFSANLFFTGSYGNDVLNVTSFYLNNGLVTYVDIAFNQTEEWYNNRWTPQHPHNDVRYPGTQKLNVAVSDITSSMVENGSYLRLKVATFSYSFPDYKFLKSPRLFVTGTNIFTLTKYTGFDPEVSAYGQTLLLQGIDFGSYPSQKNYTIGISCNF